MALSGTISKSITGREYRIEWSATQSIANNTSTITCVHKLINSAGYSLDIYGRTNSCTVGSDTKSFTSPAIKTSGGSTINLGTTTHTVSHNSDGTKSVTITGVFNIQATLSGNYVSSVTATGTVTLNTIPRTSTVSATNANIGSPTTITITRASSNFKHTLTYSFAGLTGTIETQTANTSIRWTVPTSFYAKIPNDPDGTCTITCTTYSGSTSIGSSQCTFKAIAAEANCKPTVTVTAVDTNTNTIALTGSNKKIVKGYSNVLVTTTATAKNSATISSVSVTCGSDTKSGTSVTFSGAGSSTITATAKDSRGHGNTATASGLTLINYIEPTIVETIERESPTSDKVNITAKGNWFNGSFGSVANTLIVEVRYKPKSQSEYTNADIYHGMTVTKSGNTYTASITLNGLVYTQAYDIRIRVRDAIHEYENSIADPVWRVTGISKGIPVFDWGENDFRFNVPVILPNTTTIDGEEDPSVAATRGYVNNHISAQNQHGLVKFRAYEFTGGSSNWASFTDNWDSVAIGTFSALLKSSGGGYGCCFGFKVSADYGAAIYFSYGTGTATMYRYLTGTWYQNNLN